MRPFGARRRTRPDATFRYADHDDAVIDVHLPDASLDRPRDLLVFLHGGFWKTAYDRRHTRPLARALADEGWVVATPEYRRVGAGKGGGGGWPTTGEDVRTALRRLPELLEGIGLDHRRSGRTVVSGHSAGGQLALWIANEDALPVDRVVALAPVCDLTGAARLGLGDNATQALMRSTSYDVADPMVRLRDRPVAEIALVHGIEDTVVPISLSRGLVQAHPWVGLRELAGVGHYEVIEPDSSAWPAVAGAIGLPGRS